MTVWNHDDAEAYLLRRINYETQLASERVDSFRLRSMWELVERLGHPERCAPVVHVAGTKGKGSTSSMTAAILQTAGLSVGLYTSPHLLQLEERIVINGQPVSGSEFASAIQEVAAATEAIDSEIAAGTWDGNPPTYFDLLTAAAWCLFRDRAVDVMVIEVGLGGRLDSTNVVQPILSVITNISLDHTKQLGNTTALIASEKAGIIKPGIPVLSGVRDAPAAEVIRATAFQKQAPLCRLYHEIQIELSEPCDAGRLIRPRFDWVGPTEGVAASSGVSERLTLTDLQPAYAGTHQASNAALAVGAALFVLSRLTLSSQLTIGSSHHGFVETVRAGLRQAQLSGRIELVSREPSVVVDVAHNAAALQALLDTLKPSTWPGKRTLILAISEDKDVEMMTLLLVPHFDRIVVTRFLKNPRAVDPAKLIDLISTTFASLTDDSLTDTPLARSQSTDFPPPALRCPEIVLADDPAQAWEIASRDAGANDLICITGSTFLIAEIRPLIDPEKASQTTHPSSCD